MKFCPSLSGCVRDLMLVKISKMSDYSNILMENKK